MPKNKNKLTPKRLNFGQTPQKPNSCRTIIMDLEDLIEK